MTQRKVTLTRTEDYEPRRIHDALLRHIKLLGGLSRFVSPADKVLIKPNFIAPRSSRHATQTHPQVVIELARILKDFGARPFVGDSPAWGSVFGCVNALKLEEPLKKLSVPVKQLNKPRKCRIEANNTAVGISSVALDADVIINLAKFKSHQQLVATFAVKNMFGCVSGKKKAYWHFARGGNYESFCRFLIGIYNYLSPAFTIIDAVTAMDGPGPILGRARHLGYIIGGTEPISCETVCCRLINLRPESVPMIKTARRMGFGCSELDKIEIACDGLVETGCDDFVLPKLIPIRFSFLHVCKSVCKQIYLLVKSALRRYNRR